jgi:hypothetical protein
VRQQGLKGSKREEEAQLGQLGFVLIIGIYLGTPTTPKQIFWPNDTAVHRSDGAPLPPRLQDRVQVSFGGLSQDARDRSKVGRALSHHGPFLCCYLCNIAAHQLAKSKLGLSGKASGENHHASQRAGLAIDFRPRLFVGHR